MPTLTQLEYIVAVSQFRHFGQAAKDRNVSQPSLSIQIQKVEEILGVALFDREAKPIRVTPKGEEFVRQAQNILREHQKLIDLARMENTEPSGPLRLAVIPTLSPYLIPLFLTNFSKHYPKIQTSILELQTEVIIQDLLNEKLDAAILATPLHENTIKEDPLFYEPFYLYHSPDHPLSHRKNIKISDLHKTPSWILSDGHCFRNQMLSFCSRSNEERVLANVQFQSGNFETIRNLVDRSESYTLFPRLFVDQLPKAVQKNQVKSFSNPCPTREVSLIYKRQVWKGDILKALKTSIIENLPPNLALNPKGLEVLGIQENT